MNQPTDKSVN